MIHQLKTEPRYFEAITSGKKPFEARHNDRSFTVGDFLALNEIDGDTKKETGRCCIVEVTYVLTDERFVMEGWAVLGIRPCVIGRCTERLAMYDAESFYQVRVYAEPQRTGEGGRDVRAT